MRALLAVAALVGLVALAGCDSGTASDQSTLSSVEATVGAVESEVAGDAGR